MTTTFPSSDGKTQYEVSHKPGSGYLNCSCPGFKFRRACWHVTKVQAALPGGSPVGMLWAALKFQERGYHVIPIQPRSKVPMVSWQAFQTVAATRAQVSSWWSNTPDANIGLVISGNRLVIDLDGGAAAEELLASVGVILPAEAPRVKTASGFHVYLQAPRAVGDRIGLLKGSEPIPGSLTPAGKPRVAQVDVRGLGIIIAPPSVHPSGVLYEWQIPLTENLPAAPERLMALLAPHKLWVVTQTNGRTRHVTALTAEDAAAQLRAAGKGVKGVALASDIEVGR